MTILHRLQAAFIGLYARACVCSNINCSLILNYYLLGAEVAIELGESAVSEHNSDSNSDRSEISNAPTVEHFNISVSIIVINTN